MYILFFKDKQILAIYKKEANRTYHTQYSMEEIATEEELITRIAQIDEGYVYVTEEEKRQKNDGFSNN